MDMQVRTGKAKPALLSIYNVLKPVYKSTPFRTPEDGAQLWEIRFVQITEVSAVDDVEAMRKAKKFHPCPAIEKAF